ncbi:MAG: cupin domain-containing protein [Candidatus Latescibacterota bacterium]|nr:MAG: cupin domain-containing protein [Candidatus Latescibacterota bacterium]
MLHTKLSDIEAREVVPGFRAKFVHSDHMTIAYWEADAGAEVPEHNHPHEQVVNLMEGNLDLFVDGALLELGPGSVVVLPPNVQHSAKAKTDCRIADVFFPVREDYR